jgi:hypothetical protein
LLAVLNYGIGLFTNAQDARHGYSVDPWLTADQGIERVMSLEHKCVISLATAQRLAKIALLRNRLGAGSTTITMGLSAYQAIPCDVIQLNFAPRGWVNQLFEITGVQFRPDYADDGPPRLVVDLTIQETDPAIYEWQPAPVGGSPINDELDINDTPTGQMTQYSYQVQAPTNVAVTDSISTAVTTPDGVTRPRLSVSWTPATDAYVTQYQKQIQLVGSPTWLDAGLTDAANSSAFIDNVVSGQNYNVRVRSLTPRGAASAWVTINGHNVANAYSQVNSLGLAPGVNPNAPNTAKIDWHRIQSLSSA